MMSKFGFTVVSTLLVLAVLTACGGGGGGSAAAPASNVPRFAYVANINDDTVSIYAVNAATGQLRHNGYVSVGSRPRSITVDPAGKFVYVANSSASTVSAYSINAATGALTLSTDLSLIVGNGPVSFAVDPSGRFAYVANFVDGVSAYKRNTDTGVFSQVLCGGGLACNLNFFLAGANPISVTIDPSGKFAYVANNFNGAGGNSVSAFSIDATTGALTKVGTDVAAGTSPFAVTVDPLGKFAYVANNFNGAGGNSVSAFSIDATGALTRVGTDVAAGTGPTSVTIDSSGTFAYVANSFNGAGGNSISTFTIDATTGALTRVGTDVTAGTSPISVTIDPSGKFAYVANFGSDNISTFSIDATTGALTALSTVTGRDGSFAIAMSKGTAAVRYAPKFAYVANQGSPVIDGSGSVSAYTINAATGALNQVACTGGALVCTGSNFTAGIAPFSVSVDPSGKFAYVANASYSAGGDSVSAYTIDAANGALTRVGTDAALGSMPSSVTVDPSGKFVYVVTIDGVSAFKINAATGALTQVSCSGDVTVCNGNAFLTGGASPEFVTVDPAGRFAYVTNISSASVSAYSMNAVTGALTRIDADSVAAGVQNFPAGPGAYTVTIDPAGRFAYVANSGSSSVTAYTINAGTGALTQVLCGAGAGCSGDDFLAGSFPSSVTVDPTGRFAYVTNALSNNVSVYGIAPETGALSSIGTVAVTAPRFAGFDPSGAYVYVTNSDGVSHFRMNAGSGELISVGTAAPAGTSPSSIATTGTIQ